MQENMESSVLLLTKCINNICCDRYLREHHPICTNNSNGTGGEPVLYFIHKGW